MSEESSKAKDKSKDASKDASKAGPSESAPGAKDEDKPGSADSSKVMDMETLGQYLGMCLGIREKPPSKLSQLNLQGIAEYLASDQCRNVVTMAGAGISTSAGIPDFRTPGTGLYDNLAEYDLPDPQAIFALDFFKENPKPFFTLAKALYPGSFKPTVCHYFLKLLNDKGKLLRHFTQNIDTLERVAGLDGDKLVEAHGTFHSNHCLRCGHEQTQEWMKAKIFNDTIPTCTLEGCEGVVKPDIVFFGESLPKRFAERIEDFNDCDLLVVLGTSLQVQPFASLVNRVPLTTPRLYINLEKGSTTSNPISAIMFGGGFEFDAEDNYRDIFHQATCDDGCQELADLLGWGDELKALVKSEHKRIDESLASVSKKKT